MKRRRVPFDPSKVLLVEQALKLTPSQRFQYALGLARFAVEANPQLLEHREILLRHDRAVVSPRRASSQRHD